MHTISPKQLDANRANAQKSTGPRTEEGKARSRENATKHGLTATTLMVLPHEEELHDETDAFIQGLYNCLAPVGHEEEFLAYQMVAIAQRLMRVPALEAEELRELRAAKHQEDHPRAKESIGTCLNKYARYESSLHRRLSKLQEELLTLKKQRRHRVDETNPSNLNSPQTVAAGLRSEAKETAQPVKRPPSYQPERSAFAHESNAQRTTHNASARETNPLNRKRLGVVPIDDHGRPAHNPNRDHKRKGPLVGV